MTQPQLSLYQLGLSPEEIREELQDRFQGHASVTAEENEINILREQVQAETGLQLEDKPFRLNAQTVFYTYSRCPLEAEYVVDWFLQQWADIRWITFSNEHHADGGLHLHGVVKFSTKWNRADATRLFDIPHGDTTYHPEFKGARSVVRCLRYLQKEKFHNATGDLKTPERVPWPGTQSRKAVDHEAYHAVLRKSSTPTDFVDGIREVAARDFVIHHGQLKSFADSYYREPQIYKAPFDWESFLHVPPEMSGWVEEVFADVSA